MALIPDHLALRIVSAGVFIACISLLLLAASLAPDEHGYGTHEQLGIRPCSWLTAGHGPCPTCGMTTAFSLAAHGQIGKALITQPASTLLAILTAMTAWVSGYTMLTGCTMVRKLGRMPGLPPFLAGAGIVAASWLYTRLTYG